MVSSEMVDRTREARGMKGDSETTTDLETTDYRTGRARIACSFRTPSHWRIT